MCAITYSHILLDRLNSKRRTVKPITYVTQVLARKRREGGFVVDFKGKGVVDTIYNHVMHIASLKQLAPVIPKAFAFRTLAPNVKK